MMDIEYGRPKLDDVEKLNEFFALVVRDTFEKNGIGFLEESISTEIQHKKVMLNQDFESNGQERFFLVAKEGDEVVGTIEYGSSNELIHTCTKGELKDIKEIGTGFVHPEYQQKGIGNTLINLILTEMDKKGIEEFCFDSGYKSAQKIWSKKFGAPTYHIKDFWGEDADHMIWRLKVKDVL